MKAIEYIVRNGAGFVQRGTLVETGISDSLTLGAYGAVSLNIGRSSIREYLRVGRSLEIHLVDGRKIVLENFFSEDGVQGSQLYLNENGALIEAWMDPSGYMTFSEAAEWGKWSHLDALMFPDGSGVITDVVANEVATQGVGAGLLGFGGGGLGVVGPLVGGAAVVGALVGGSGGKGVVAAVDGADTTKKIGGGDDQEVVITGTAEPGSEVLITIGDEKLTVTTGDDGRWTGTFKDGDFPADGDYVVAVQVTEPDGEVVDLTGPAVLVDTVAPELNVTDGTDEVVNGTAHEDGVTISGTGEAGATISVEIDGTTHTTTVSEGGTWSVTFDSSEITTGERSTNVTVVATDGFGNATTVTQTLEIDTVAPSLLIGDVQVGDNTVNEAEANAGFELTGTAEAGATITVTIGDQSWTTTAGTDGNWVITFTPGTLPGGEYDATVTAVARDGAGNETTQTTTLRIDTVGEISISGELVEGDDVINRDEASDGFTLTGTTQAGSTVVVTFEGVNYDATVAADGTWTLDLPASGIRSGTYDSVITMTATDSAGNVSTITRTVRVDTETTVTLNGGIAGDNTINAIEHEAGVTLTGMAEAGATVVVTFNGANHTATVAADGSWSLTLTSADIPEGQYEAAVTATATDAAGNVASTAQTTVQIDTLAYVAFSTTPVEGDNVINAAEASDGVTLTGMTKAGSAVVISANGADYTATVAADGSWSVNIPAAGLPSGETDVVFTATATSSAGNVATAIRTVAVDTVASVDISSTIEGDNTVNAIEAADGVTLAGTAEAGSTVQVTFLGKTMSATVDGSGNWTVDFPADDIRHGDYTATVTAIATDAAGNTSTATADLAIDTVVPEAPYVSGFSEVEGTLTKVITPLHGDTPVISEVASDGTVETPTYTVEEESSLGRSYWEVALGEAVPDGSSLVLTAGDDAGNKASTLFVLEDSEGGLVNIDNSGLEDFDIGAIDLTFEENLHLVLTAEQLEDLSEHTNNLTVHGGDDDTVTITGATNTGESVVIEGTSYDVYTLGDDGGKLFIEDEINVII